MTATATVHKQRYKHKDKLTSIARPLQEMTKDTSDDQVRTQPKTTSITTPKLTSPSPQTLIPARTTVLQTTELLELIVSALTPGVRLLNEHTETSTREHPQLDYTWSIDTVQTTVREVQVLDATELREPTLKIMRLVCKRFRDVVDASPRLQKRLGEVVGGKDNIVYVID